MKIVKMTVVGLLALTIIVSSFTAHADETAANSCRTAVESYQAINPRMIKMCDRANQYSAQAVGVFASIYTTQLAFETLKLLLEIDTQESADCAIGVAQHYDGLLSTKYLRTACF